MTHYLIKRGSIFYFNRRIRGNILRISLSTDNQKLAKEIAASLYLVTTKGIRHQMSYEQIKLEAQRIAAELHDEWFEDHLSSGFNTATNDYIRYNDDEIISELSEAVHLRKLKGNALKNALTDLMFIGLKRKTLAEFSNPQGLIDNLLEPTSNSAAQLDSSEAIHQVLLTDKFEEFIEDKKTRSKDISDATIDEYRLSVSELEEICGNKSVSEFSFDNGKLYRNTMMQLPKHRKKGPHKGKSINELITLDFPDDQKLSAKTINGRIAKLITYFTWLNQNQLINHNPFQNLKLQEDGESYNPYSDSDLKLIFSTPLFSDAKYRKSKRTGKQSQWWLLVLAAYTGARLGELVQLRLEDITNNDGVLSINITDEGDDMRLKTTAGRRKIPAHPDLLKLDFEEFVTSLRNTNQERLLPQLPISGKKIGSRVSNWYNDRYRAFFMPNFKAEKKVFHSFRHTFIQRAIHADLELQHLQQMVGHEKKLFGETTTYARDGYSQEQLQAELAKFSYVDFSIDDIAGGWKDLHPPEPIAQ